MDVDIDSSTALYGIAAFLGAVTVVYFGSSLIFDLSPVTKSLAFVSSFVVFLAVSMYISGENKSHSLISLSIAGISYLAFLTYALGKFEISSEGVFFSLLFSSILFVTLGYLKNRGGLDINKKQLKSLMLGMLVLGSLLVAADIMGSQPVYSLELHDDVVFQRGEQSVIGELEVKNNFILHREMSSPSFSACTGQQERRLYVDLDTDEIIGGMSQKSFNLTVEAHWERLGNNSESFRLERSSSCPGNAENRTLYVFKNEDSTPVEYID